MDQLKRTDNFTDTDLFLIAVLIHSMTPSHAMNISNPDLKNWNLNHAFLQVIFRKVF